MDTQTYLHPHYLRRDEETRKREAEESAKRYAILQAVYALRAAYRHGKYMDRWRYRTERPGVRYMQRTAPLWMEMNLHDGKCWCGRPKAEFEPNQKKYCCYGHYAIWTWGAAAGWGTFRDKILLRDGHTCASCGKREKDMAVDHILPIALGGACYDEANLQTLCIGCHKKKTRNDMRNLKLHRHKMNAQAFGPDGAYHALRWYEVYGAQPPW